MNASSLIVLLAFAAPLASQQPDSTSVARPDGLPLQREHGGPGRWRDRDHWRGAQRRANRSSMGARRGMPFDPARLLARKDALGLSDEQVSRLTALQTGAAAGMTADLQRIKTEREAIAAGLNADAPDTAQLKRHYEALQTATGNAHWTRLDTSLQARALLTEAQRGKVRGWAALRGGRWYSKGHRNRL